ncbi:50S ribosomal protein L23 [Candidatus Roizmanbacteria bacterium CG2_30_33_16]|uniref:Large ribosomal subunit protein uL23 n=5 Tax=Candidatus Roizmaniibacteriota TaxID=1752723 RepID=A0A2M7E5M3_9BACT|nr:MAG: 50S ribosomal protein L23 [Candidatus Roizmanbacteria bacterium CG2_30_33_16]PIP64568.1 MAG: 50S ribosomal protein L23 [Candidatus Roizmanbacteria bacterium CG22_combo_CG10-13_8_21_14_all_33_16]PIV63026.1 MAG: 50S ribosomal protein L23 [Candidatus Roizmanbacteria bacterium CG01_land_8_20_14_3_00_33_9]PIX72307.1 MAG: 50S ribosomal protein L23 [Candidatus Roizmanbacteria bacterium CG_4_10_14_3_um_filter_33_21]PJB88649.1 MAG: 50S ribosomal protein L23 [Candidatus Roizmanbacteria bacterium 
MKLSDVIIKPLITEKATGKAQIEVYTFVIHNQAGKAQIKTVLESIYKVKVKSVNITNRHGKTRRVGKYRLVKTLPNKKIAYVTLKSGQIDIFPKA